MHEVNSLESLSLFVGKAKCNASCLYCAGIPHRKFSPKKDLDESLIYNTLKDCHKMGARSLSISGSGEPTLSPRSISKTLKIMNDCKNEGISYEKVNLYSNGIRIGEDIKFCKKYLQEWKEKGLDWIYITVHDIDERRNATEYGIKEYPSLEKIFSRIHENGMSVRANIILKKTTVKDCDDFIRIAHGLKTKGIDSISAWKLRGPDDKIDIYNSTIEKEFLKIYRWARDNPEYNVRVLSENNRILYATRKKLTLFPDGTLSSSWCNY